MPHDRADQRLRLHGLCTAVTGLAPLFGIATRAVINGPPTEVLNMYKVQDLEGSVSHRRITLLVVAVAALFGAVSSKAPAAQKVEAEAAPIYGVKLPKGYRDWTMISAANVGAPVNDLRIKLGNDIAIQAYRDDKRPFPDGTIIARLAYQQITSEENNKVFRAAAEQRGLPAEQIDKLLAASFVAGPPTNVQFMVKDSRKYASTGGWGFAQFTKGKPDDEAVHRTCFACHAPAKDRDFVFTRYSP
jgi:Cytochrome P460